MDTTRQAQIERAMSKAFEQARADNLPTLLGVRAWSNGVSQWRWSVASRTVAGVVYLITLCDDHGLLTSTCDCPAVDVCWHRAAARLAYAGRLASWRVEPAREESIR
jgi:hypothetical protein